MTERLQENQADLDKTHQFREGLRELRATPHITTMEEALDDEEGEAAWDATVYEREADDEVKIQEVRASIGLRENVEDNPESDAEPVVDKTAEQELGRVLSEVFESKDLDTASERFAQEALAFFGSLREKKTFSEKSLEILEKLRTLAPQISQALDKVEDGSDYKNLAKTALGVVEKFKLAIPKESFDSTVKEIKQAEEAGDGGRLKKIASTGIDFIPVIGPAKMLVEAVKGKTLDGQKLSGWKRALHALEGGSFFILDMTGVGAIGTKAVKGSVLGAKILTRSAAVARTAGIGREIYAPLFKAGKMITRNKTLARLVDKTFDQFATKRRYYGNLDRRRAA
ncbi:MAG: hypothetical protein A2751_05860 [Candidatus Doudnabacteria bacterium RIFCSPHIGHO2_01_FULL_46_14]|uniref:Pre-toxin TG domain-containing protein n=1 Tax=Candidatus Doudnabacteria bacterium RIFCSPHIGHO2_01_FULL_46_14 TaxID=1817824 RepID=A0A1F5NNN3_9BACT|nr:MAG: hypothetical protein A2751_05860 [Candidatus Doudnabacteria bacterium RIFCSPHIGHO2_01_FULL_46_14]